MFRQAARQISSAGLAVFALIVSVGVSTAEASTVERIQRTDPFGYPTGSYYLQYTAAPGEVNDLEIRLDAGGVTLRDAGRALAAKGCEQIDASTARCGSGDSLAVKLADGDDVARVVDTRPPPTDAAPGPDVSIEAGAGADSLTGGPADEVFTDGGGGEPDRFAGGGGSDRVSYAGRKTPVRITVGAPGEDVFDSIETLEGGSGADVLTGDAGPNGLWGGPGEDTLRGLAGRDDLDGDAGSDRLYGGPGNDLLSGDSFTSGLGRDLLDGGRGDDFLDLSVADDAVFSVGGPSFATSTDGRRDTVRGGPGYDAFRYRDAFDPVRSCEAASLGEEYIFGRTLRRVSLTRLRLRVGYAPGDVSEETRVALAPRGRGRPRLSKPVRIDDEGTFTLRLTAAGVTYLRRRSAVTIISTDSDESVDARVSRRGG